MTPFFHVPRPRVGRRPVSGLGIVEAVILLSAVGLLISIAVPFGLRGAARRETARAAEELARTLRLARERAALLERPVHVEIEPDGEGGFYTAYVRFGDDPARSGASAGAVAAAGMGFVDARGGVPGTVLPEDVRFAAHEAGAGRGVPGLPPNPIVFGPDGRVGWPGAPPGGSGVIVLSHDRHSEEMRAVSIRRDGEVTVWSYAGGAWR